MKSDAEKFIIHDILICLGAILVNFMWDFIHIEIRFGSREFSLGAAQILILIVSVVWLFVSLNRWRYYK